MKCEFDWCEGAEGTDDDHSYHIGGFSPEVWSQPERVAYTGRFGWVGGINRNNTLDRLLELHLRKNGYNSRHIAVFIINKTGRWLDDSIHDKTTAIDFCKEALNLADRYLVGPDFPDAPKTVKEPVTPPTPRTANVQLTREEAVYLLKAAQPSRHNPAKTSALDKLATAINELSR